MHRGSEIGAYGEAIVETIAQPLLVLDEHLRVLFANPAFYQQFAVTVGETADRLIYDLSGRQWDIPELRRLLERILATDSRIENYRIQFELDSMGERIMMLSARRMKCDGAPDRVLVAISDVTEREQLILDLKGEKEFAEKLIGSVRESLLVLGNGLRVKYANQSFYDRFRVTPEETEGRLVYEPGDGQWDIPELRTALQDILPRESTIDDCEITHDFARIGRRTVLLNARQLDHMSLILLTIRDVTDAREYETRQKLLTAELQHRVKNILNNIHALAQQTRRRAGSLDDFFTAFEARLHALARSQDLLVRSPTQAIRLRDIVDLEMAAGGAESGVNYTVDGPQVSLAPRMAQAFAMTVHELVTNAAKYGALSVEGGTIEINWDKETRNRHERLAFNWREHGVAIEDCDPMMGFGSRVIERNLPHMLGGTGKLTLHPDGADCRLEFPL